MDKFSLVEAKLTYTLDYTEAINQAIEEGYVSNNEDDIKRFILDWVAEDASYRLMDLIEDDFDLKVIK